MTCSIHAYRKVLDVASKLLYRIHCSITKTHSFLLNQIPQHMLAKSTKRLNLKSPLVSFSTYQNPPRELIGVLSKLSLPRHCSSKFCNWATIQHMIRSFSNLTHQFLVSFGDKRNMPWTFEWRKTPSILSLSL